MMRNSFHGPMGGGMGHGPGGMRGPGMRGPHGMGGPHGMRGPHHGMYGPPVPPRPMNFGGPRHGYGYGYRSHGGGCLGIILGLLILGFFFGI